MHLIKKFREEAGKTQGEFAKELKISQSALSQIEKKNMTPSMKNFLMLVKLGYINADNIFSIVQKLIKHRG